MCSVSERLEALKITQVTSYEVRKNEDTLFLQMLVLHFFIYMAFLFPEKSREILKGKIWQLTSFTMICTYNPSCNRLIIMSTFLGIPRRPVLTD